MTTYYYYSPTGNPQTLSRGASSLIRNEFIDVANAFAMLPSPAVLAGDQQGYAVDEGTLNAVSVPMPQNATSLTDGMKVEFKLAFSPTGAMTITVGTFTVNLTRPDGSAIQQGDLFAGQMVECRYSSTQNGFQILNYGAGSLTQAATAAVTALNAATTASNAATTATTEAGNASASAVLAQNAESATAAMLANYSTTAQMEAAIAVNTYGRNFIDNPEARIVQRGANYSLTNALVYGSADRWAVVQNTTAQGHFNGISSSLPQFSSMFQLGRTSGATSIGNIAMAQALTSQNSIPLSGTTVVLSFFAYAGANFSAAGNQLFVKLYSGTGTDQSVTAMNNGTWTGQAALINTSANLTTGVVRYQYSVNVPASVNQLGVEFGYTPTGTAGADDNLYITGIKLEPVPSTNPIATPFISEDIGIELLRCLKYYSNLAQQVISGYSTSGGNIYLNLVFPVRMRATPTMATTSITYVNCSGINTALYSNESFVFYSTVTTTGVATVQFNATFSADL